MPPSAETEHQSELPASGAPVAIPASDIPSRADEVSADLRRIEALLEPIDEIEALRTEIEARKDVVVTLHAELDALGSDSVSARMLEDHRLKWVKLQAQLDTWMAGLQQRWRVLQEEREGLERTSAQWEATREAGASEDFSAELLQPIDAILERLRTVAALGRERIDGLASVIDRVSRGQDVAAEALETVNEMAAVVRERWLDRDEPPLWELTALEHSSSLWGEAREG